MRKTIRSQTWISGDFAAQDAGLGGGNFKYSDKQLEAFKKNRGVATISQVDEACFNKLHVALNIDTLQLYGIQEEARQISLTRLDEDKELAKSSFLTDTLAAVD